MSPNRGPWWQLFESTGTKYAGNGSYPNAWCKACIAKHIEHNEKYDTANAALGRPEAPRTMDQLRRIGTQPVNYLTGIEEKLIQVLFACVAFGPKACTDAELREYPFTQAETEARPVEPIYGRASTMAAHAWKCVYTDKDDVAKIEKAALLESKQKQANRAARANLESTLPVRATPLSRSSSYTFGATSSPSNSAFTFTPGPGSTPFPSHPGTPQPQSADGGSPEKRTRITSNSDGSGAINSAAWLGPGPLFPPLWDDASQHEFGQDLCKVFVACKIPWNVVDHPQFRQFFAKYLAFAHVPDRRSLSGMHLDRAAAAAEEDTLKRVRGRLAMGQCDGWKNVAKTNVISSVMSVDYEVSEPGAD